MSASTTGLSQPSPGPEDFSLLAPEVRENPYPYYAALRRESPIHQLVPGAPLYAITRYEDVLHILHHPEIFSSSTAT